MRKTILFLIFIIVLILSSCGRTTSTPKNNSITPQYLNNEEIYIFTDSETGCEYLVFKAPYKGGLTSRLDSNGIPICGEVE